MCVLSSLIYINNGQECIPVGCVPPAQCLAISRTAHPPFCHACPPLPCMPPFTMHAPLCHACPPSPCMHPRSNHTCPPQEQPRMPPQSNHACPPWEQPHTPLSGATTHAPCPRSNHAHPPPPEQPCTPLGCNHAPPCEQTDTCKKHNLRKLRLRAVKIKKRLLQCWPSRGQ